jgi:hypothetical protein
MASSMLYSIINVTVLVKAGLFVMVGSPHDISDQRLTLV